MAQVSTLGHSLVMVTNR